MNKKSIVSMAIVMGSTAALFIAIYALQYYQSRFTQGLFSISPETAISIVAEKQNLTSYDTSDYLVRYVNIKGNGTVFSSDLGSNSIGGQVGTAEPTLRRGSYFAWEVNSKSDNSTYYVESKSGEIVSKKSAQ
jgi:uncharacterized protein YpmB